MPDRILLTFPVVAVASGNHYRNTISRVTVPVPGSLLVAAVSVTSATSNSRINSLDFYRQPVTSRSSNAATPILTVPIAIPSDYAGVVGKVRASNARVAAGDQIELRMDGQWCTYGCTPICAHTGRLYGISGSLLMEVDPYE